MECQLTNPFPCDYIPTRISQNLLLHPTGSIDPNTYERLLDKGFRRSGRLIYRPQCRNCQQCVSVRIPIHEHRISKNQRRLLKKHAVLDVSEPRLGFNAEHFRLYCHYLSARHPNSNMADPMVDDYLEFIAVDTGFTRMLAFHLNDELVMVCVYDVLPKALSAVYCFYATDQPGMSLGSYAIYYQILLARQLNLDWLYLGYWIEDCDTMAYKRRYSPLQGFIGQQWSCLERISILTGDTGNR